MRRPPPPHPRGTPRTPGSGRRRGSLNRRTIELRALLGSLCHDITYQDRLRRDFRLRRVHPAIESLAWGHVIGKPAERVQLSADVSMNQTLAEERELFGRLSVEQLEELAADSAALIAKARLMARSQQGSPVGTPLLAAPPEDSVSSDAPGPTYAGADVARSGNGAHPAADGAHAHRTLVPVGASSAPAASVTDIATGEPADESTSLAVSDERDAARANTAPRDIP